MHVADLREGRDRDLGDAGARLSQPGERPSALRTAWLPAGHLILLVSLQPVAREAPLRSWGAPGSVADRPGRAHRPRGCLEVVGRRSRKACPLAESPWQGRLPQAGLGCGGGASVRIKL